MRESPEYGKGVSRYGRRRSSSVSSRGSGAQRRQSHRDYDRGDRRKDKYLSRKSQSRSRERKTDSNPRHRRDRSSEPKRRDVIGRRSRSPSPARRAKGPLPSQNDSYRKEVGPPSSEQPQKQKPNFKPTGLLAKEANTVAGTTTVLKYHEPTEARKPPSSQQWRMYVFKHKDLVDTVYLFQRSCWLIGREQKVTDLYLEHPSISKQHAVIQFRHSSTLNEFGDKISRVRPYLIDLESANGTHLNGKRIGESRYVELVDSDVISFGKSEREYVMMLPAPDKKKDVPS